MSGRSFALNSTVLAFVSETIPNAKITMQTVMKTQYSGEL